MVPSDEDRKEGKNSDVKPFAFVCYKSPDVAQKAKASISEGAGFNKQPLYVNFYEIKEIREVQKEEVKDKHDFMTYKSTK